jgi:hypothetical protein
MYVDPDYKTKKEFKLAVEQGKVHYAYVPGGLYQAAENGDVTIEGPHYPKPHKWYARVRLEKGRVVKLLS